MAQVEFCPPIGEELFELEKDCGVLNYSNYQTKYNILIQKQALFVNINTPAIAPENNRTFLFFLSRYYTSQLLFQNIRFIANSRNKFILDFYQIFRVHMFENKNINNNYTFPLSTSQGGHDANDTFTINPIKKLFQLRGIIVQVDFTSCQLPINQNIEQQNQTLPSEIVFEDLNDLINSPIKKNFNVVYDKVHTLECTKCDYEQTICFNWKIEKQWCITCTNDQTPNVFV